MAFSWTRFGGIAFWCGALSVSVTFLCTATIFILVKNLRQVFGAKVGIPAGTFCVIYLVSISLCWRLGKFEELPVLTEEEAKKKKLKKTTIGVIKLFLDAIINIAIVVYSTLHTNVNHGKWHAILLGVACSLLSITSSVLGIVFVQGPLEGYGVLITAFTTAILYFIGDKMFVVAGILGVVFVYMVAGIVLFNLIRLEWPKINRGWTLQYAILSVAVLGIGVTVIMFILRRWD